jgi:hypothetical protein
VSELINRWFSRAGRAPGMVACGLRYSDGSVFSKTWELHLPETLLNELWNRLVPIAEVATTDAPESLRWSFDKNVVLAASRANGPIFFALMSRKGEELDTAGVERLLNEFRALRGQGDN